MSTEKNTVLEEQLHGRSTNKNRHRTVLSYATRSDIAILTISCLFAAIAGGLNPLLTVLYGQLVGSFDRFQNGTLSGSDLRADISRFTLYFVYLAIAMFFAVYITTVGFYYSGERITQELRRSYLKSTIRQNMAFFDTLGTGELTSRLTSEITHIQEAITGNLSVCLTAAATFIAAFVIAFVEYWKLALILSSTVIVLTVTGSVGTYISVKYTKRSMSSHRTSTSIAEEAISAVKYVTAFGIQETMMRRYVAHLSDAEVPGLKAGITTALMNSMVNAIPYFSYALSFWEGSRLLVRDEMSISGVTTSTLAIVIGAWAVGRVAPNAKALISSMASASTILQSIDRESTQDPFSDGGTKPTDIAFDILLQDVELVYPSRQEVKALDGLDLVVAAGKTTAIVGASGCGKSSIIGLLERFYTPTKGRICK
jgi:ATP-binding cassette subfamily B (MDR/TAP) protein 1